MDKKFTFQMQCVLLCVFVGLTVIYSSLMSSILGISLLTGSNFEYVMKLVFFLSISSILAYPSTRIISDLFHRHLKSLIYRINKHKYDSVSELQLKSETLLSVISLLLIVLLSYFYSVFRHPVILSCSVFFGAILFLVWSIQRKREWSSCIKIYQKTMFILQEIFLAIAILVSFLSCHLVLHIAFSQSEELDLNLQRAIAFYQLSEAILLGFIVGFSCETLAKVIKKAA